MVVLPEPVPPATKMFRRARTQASRNSNISGVAVPKRTRSSTVNGVAEISKSHKHVRGAVALAHSGRPERADSQFYIMKRASPSLDGKHAVIGRVIAGMDVVDKLQRGDLITKVSVKGGAPQP